MMKKVFAVLLAMAVCACVLYAAAEEPAAEKYPVAGLSFTPPRAFSDAKGCVGTDGVRQLDDSFYYVYWYYIAAGQEELTRLTAEDAGQIQGKTALLFYTFSVGENRGVSAVAEATGGAISGENTVQIGQEDSWSFYLYMAQDPGFMDSVDRGYEEEYAALCGMQEEIAAAFSCFVPFNEYGRMDGEIVRFTAEDLDGSPVSSEEIFAQHEITMVNIWTTWCGYCIDELASLQELHTRLEEKDCAVLGVLDDDDVETARGQISENGVKYRVVVAPENFSSIFPYNAYPTTFYVDRNGAFLGTKIVGAQPDMYESALDPLLAQVKGK